MRRWTLLLAGAALWLFLAAIPALADGGPHVATTNSGASTLTADSCAGCHRAHTAQGQYLITASNEEALCLTCHGAQSSGAATDVATGIQYATAADHNTAGSAGAQLGALRAGGFEQARLGVPARLSTSTGSLKTKVTVGAAVNTTSAHLKLHNGAGADLNPGVTSNGIAWGNGANGSGDGPAVALECTSCHNPHGNGNYRILNPLPTATDGVNTTTTASVQLVVASTNALADTIITVVGHPYQVGDLVTLTGLIGIANGNYSVISVPDGTKFQVATTLSGTAFNITSSGAGGTVQRTSAPVTDSPLGLPDGNGVYATKNYTVIQRQGTQATGANYLFYASQVAAYGGPTTGDYFHRAVPWSAASGGTDDAPNGMPATVAASNQVAFNVQITAWCSSCHTRYLSVANPNPTGTDPGSSAAAVRTVASSTAATNTITTSASHGFVIGDVVTVSGINNLANTSYTVATVPSSTTFTLSGATVGDGTYAAGPPPAATVVRSSAPQTASSWWFPRTDGTTTGGTLDPDTIYKFQHRTVPNRACTTCHVAHGSNAAMTGTYSSSVPLPNGVVSDSSRLLKIDNRGTCQACHDPTGTFGNSNYNGPLPTPGVP